jgi:DNA-binding LacI/PurR family transcriptional regulator
MLLLRGRVKSLLGQSHNRYREGMGDGAGRERSPVVRRRLTILDIANEAGVSKGSVSMVLSGAPGPSAATIERVLAIADRLGYRANRTASLLARRRTRLLGVTMIPSNVFHGELVEEIQVTADKFGYELVLGAITDSHDERRAIETLIDFRCEALLLLGPTMRPDKLATIVDGVATVCVGRPLDLPRVDVVRADDKQGFADLVDHLVSLGHQHIAHVDGGAGVIADGRRRAFRAAIRRHGLTALVLRGGLTEEDGADALDGLSEAAGVTAVVAFNDRTAVGALDRLESEGRKVPADMSVTGFDDSIIARHSRIALTSVNQTQTKQARLAVEAAIERLDGGRTERREIVLPASLVVRGSTGPPGGRR